MSNKPGKYRLQFDSPLLNSCIKLDINYCFSVLNIENILDKIELFLSPGEEKIKFE